MLDSSNRPPDQSSWSDAKDRLDSWKEIASYLQRTLATVRRWEKEEGLPVRRHVHHKKASVYAYRSEIDTWQVNRSSALANDKPGWFRFFSDNKKTVAGIAGGVTLLLLVGLVAWMETGSSSNPEGLSFQERDGVLNLLPNDSNSNFRAGYQLVLDGDLDRAKPYVMSALDLTTPETNARHPRAGIWLMLFPAYDALLAGDPETALFEAKSRLWDTLDGEAPITRNIARSMLGALYLTAGQIDVSREWFEGVYNAGPLRQYFLAAIAYVEEDHEAMTKHLEEMLKTPVSPQRTVRTMPATTVGVAQLGGLPRSIGTRCCTALFLARGGFLLEAEAMLSSSSTPSSSFEIQRGVLAVSRGNRAEGMKVLEDALSSFRSADKTEQLLEAARDRRNKQMLVMHPQKDSAAAYFMGSEIMAEAWRTQGNLAKAVQVLEGAAEKELLLLADQSSPLTGALWVRVQGQLAQLYREMGRDEDAQKIEEKLRALLAYADRDHPILRQLDHTKDLALREAAN